jgi:hypothetical protein
MSGRAIKAAGAASRGDGEGTVARGATHGARADEAARAAKVRRNAWLLAGVAALVYLGYIVWMAARVSGGG